jgi:hypothetical protein
MAGRIALTTGLDITARWSASPISGPLPEVNHTLCRLGIACNGKNATAFKTDKGDTGDRIEAPAYYFAEWLAVNWWAIFHEPSKVEDDTRDKAENVGFQTRHWAGTARNGFSLPDLWLVPTGNDLQVEAVPAYLSRNRLKFTVAFKEKLPIDQAKDNAAAFIDSVISRMEEHGLSDTVLQEAWALIKATGDSERLFCARIGALGLSPYEEHADIEVALDGAAEQLPSRIVRDLCEAATPETFVELAAWVRQAFGTLDAGKAEIDFSAIPARPVTPDPRPWYWGKIAAIKLRETFGVPATDPDAGEQILRSLGIDPEGTATLFSRGESLDVEGALDRHDNLVRLAVTASKEVPQRRFATTRGVFLGWGADQQDARLITRAHTREQQASRAFAAESLAPIDYIRRRAGRGLVSRQRLGEIAHELGVSPAVVAYQATNNHLPVADYR